MLRPLRVECAMCEEQVDDPKSSSLLCRLPWVPRHFPPEVAGDCWEKCPNGAHGDGCDFLTDVVVFLLGKRAIELR